MGEYGCSPLLTLANLVSVAFCGGGWQAQISYLRSFLNSASEILSLNRFNGICEGNRAVTDVFCHFVYEMSPEVRIM